MISAKKTRSLPIARFVLCVSLFLLFVSAPSASSYHMGRGITICFETLIPSLFPFMVISEILVRADIASFASRIFRKPMKLFFGVSGESAAAFLLGLLCGFPVGAKTAAALYEKGDISKQDAERLMAFSNLPSAPFMIFAVGEKLFGSRKLGIFLYLNAVTVALICGIVNNLAKRIKDRDPPRPARTLCTNSAPLINIFTDSVASAAGSVINVCAYVCFFTCGVGTLSSLIPSTSYALGTVLFSFFELTSGSAACSALEPRSLGAILAAAAAGWSGLSVFFQIFSISRTKRGDISMKQYLVSKAISALLCGINATCTIILCPSLVPTSPSDADTALHFSPYPMLFISAVNLIFIISLLIYLRKKLDIRQKI